jgi:Nif-specific regulatory protein
VTHRWASSSELVARITAEQWSQFAAFQEQILVAAAESASVDDYLRRVVSHLAGELAAVGVAIWRRTPDWKPLVQHGRWPAADLPRNVLAECLDREAAGQTPWEGASGLRLLVAPLWSQQLTSTVMVATQREGTPDELWLALLAARLLGACVDIVRQSERAANRIGHLRKILQIASAWSAVRETEPLLHRIAEEATRLVDCDRASIFLWDKEHGEVIACPALGVESGSLRLPDRTGIVGEVIHTGRPIRVDDAYADPRFSRKVDAASGYRTQNLLCVPLFDADRQLIGAFEVINKRHGPFTEEDEITLSDLTVQVAAAVQSTRERELLLRSHQQLTEQVTKGVAIIGESPPIVALRSTIRRLAATDLPVLILGESGTGKEVVAQALHYHGPRAVHPFVAVNCAALAETLLESELFGHEKGAFTDAHEMRRGKFELAEGGTILLDEIGDMSLGGQAKLLRVLEQKVITRVGGSQSIPINVRVIAATNAQLADAVRAKKFREDLYFRLNVVTLDLPPLRDRPEDVLLLAEHFLGIFAMQARRPAMTFSAEARRRLQSHTWPGNVRELRNLMERVAFLAPGEKVEAEDLAFILSPEREGFREPSGDMGLSEATDAFQENYIRKSIKRVRGNMSEAARLLGLHRSNLYRKMRQLGMSEAETGED